MSTKKIAFLFITATLIAWSGLSFARTQQSDYARDAESGNLQLKNDKAALAQAEAIKASQVIEARVSNTVVSISDTANIQEKQTNPSKTKKTPETKPQHNSSSTDSNNDKNKSPKLENVEPNNHSSQKNENNGKSE